MILVRVILLALAIWAAWWLSGFDARVTGENKPRDLERRITRCGVTAILLGIFFGAGPVGIGFIPYIIIIPTLLGVLWAGCLAELLSRGVRQLVDSDDPREYDPNESTRNHDRMADLLRSGRRAEAVRLYQELKKSGAANILVLETMLVPAWRRNVPGGPRRWSRRINCASSGDSTRRRRCCSHCWRKTRRTWTRR